MMENFLGEYANYFFSKNFNIDIWQGSKYASGFSMKLYANKRLQGIYVYFWIDMEFTFYLALKWSGFTFTKIIQARMIEISNLYFVSFFRLA